MESDLVSRKEIEDIMGWTKRHTNRIAKKEGWEAAFLKTSTDRKFYRASLPEYIHSALNKKKSQSNNIGHTSHKIGIAEIVPVGSPDLTEQQNRIALARADLIRTYLNKKKRAKANKESVVKASESFIKGYNTGQLIPNVFNVLGKTSRQTVDAWVKTFRDANNDYTILAPRWGNRKGQRKITDEEFNILLSFALHPNRLRIAEACRLTKIKLKKRNIPSPSSNDTLRRALQDWIKFNYDQWVFCREGEKALNDKVLPYLERDSSLLEVGEVLVADGHKLNFEILHPFTGKPCRMTMVMWYDWASCMPTGWEIMPTENVQCVAAGLRRAILHLGKMPRVVYLDNGKAFKAKVFTDTDIDFEEMGFYGMFARLGIETLFAWPYNAQSKPVERFFGTFNELERLMPTYTGASIQDKPAHKLRNEKLHRQIHLKKYSGWVPTIEEADRIIAGWVKEYAKRPHRGLKGLPPGEVFTAGKGPGVDDTALRYLMMSIEEKSVGRNGVRFLGRDYYDEALYGYRDRVMIRYDMEDLSKIFVYDATGSRLICEAEARTSVHPIARLSNRKEDLALVKAGIKQKRALKKATESIARAYVEQAPELVAIPERTHEVGQNTPVKSTGLTQAEAEKIEAEAAQMKVLELKPKQQEPLYMSDADRYESLLEKECKEEELALDDMTFMRYFETTEIYRTLKDRFEFLQETWLLENDQGIQRSSQ